MSAWGEAAGPVPGWYSDPWETPALRYWDGTQWTGHLTPYPRHAIYPTRTFVTVGGLWLPLLPCTVLTTVGAVFSTALVTNSNGNLLAELAGLIPIAWVLLADHRVLFRYARALEIDGAVLRWRAPFRRGEVPLDSIAEVRESWPRGLRVTLRNGRRLRVAGGWPFPRFAAALAQVRPSLPIRLSGLYNRPQFWQP